MGACGSKSSAEVQGSSAPKKTDSKGGARKKEEKDDGRTSQTILREIAPNPKVGNYLQNVPLFSNLTQSQRDALGGALKEVAYPAGTVLFSEGDKGDKFYIIKAGQVEVKMSNGTVLSKLSPGDTFGEQSLLTDTPRQAGASALGDLVCYELTKTLFNTLFQGHRIDVHFANRRRIGVSAEQRKTVRGDPSETEAVLTHNSTGKKMTKEVQKLVQDAIKQSLLFRGMESQHMQEIIKSMYQYEAKEGTNIIQEGQKHGNTFYVIETGFIHVFQKNEAGEPVKVDEHGPGHSFGELALMYDAPRNATCTTTKPSVFWVLERSVFKTVLKKIAEETLEQNVQLLNKVDLLGPLTNEERIKVAEAMVIVNFDEKSTIFNEGDAGDGLYLIVEGEVQFTDKKNGVLGTGKTGGYFGERALLNNEPRNATVKALTKVKCLRLDRQAFVLLLGPLESILLKNIEGYGKKKSEQKSTWVQEDVALKDLKVIGTLGKGSYGFVQLVQNKKKGADNSKIYALKAVSKKRIVDTHQKQHILDEKAMMTEMDHPFLIKLYATFKDRDLFYFLLEPALGGELFPHLRRMRMFPRPQTMFYAGIVVLGFEYMHNKDLIYRDLKPENLLMDRDGYIKITDFGFCKRVPHKTYTMCGTPEYLAPEIIESRRGHGKGVDWWTLGVFIYEMLASYTPFIDRGGVLAMYDKIAQGRYKFPSHFSADDKDLISGLLQNNPVKRLGVIMGGAANIKNHPWFKGFDWDALLAKKIPPPMPANVKDPTDVSNYDQNVVQDQIEPYIDDGTDWDHDF